jgi:hypothetical protein
MVLLILSLLRGSSESNGSVVYQARNFFGTKLVFDNLETHHRSLVHGKTVHGLQSTDIGKEREPLAYYGKQGPLGDIFAVRTVGRERPSLGIVGLGAGAIACYLGDQDAVTFFEIDPLIQTIAERSFSFLSRCTPKARIVLGDGRLTLNQEPQESFDVIIIDAFSSDAIPVHLLSEEAIALYRSRLRADGILVFHISNRFLDIEAVLASYGKAHDLPVLTRFDTRGGAPLEGGMPSQYAIINPSQEIQHELKQRGWIDARYKDGVRMWTDSYSNLYSILRW